MDKYSLHCYVKKGRKQEIKIEEIVYANDSKEAERMLIKIFERYLLSYSCLNSICLTLNYSDKEKENLPTEPKIANESYLVSKLMKYSK